MSKSLLSRDVDMISLIRVLLFFIKAKCAIQLCTPQTPPHADPKDQYLTPILRPSSATSNFFGHLFLTNILPAVCSASFWIYDRLFFNTCIFNAYSRNEHSPDGRIKNCLSATFSIKCRSITVRLFKTWFFFVTFGREITQ